MSLYYCDYLWRGSLARDVLLETGDGKISSIADGVERPHDAEHLSGITIPGLANVHSHAFHRSLRGHRSAGTFWTWREEMYGVADLLDPDSYYRLARAAYGEMALAGITAVGEFHYLHHQAGGRPFDHPNTMSEALVSAAGDAGIRLTLLDACYLQAGFGREPEGVQKRFSDGTALAWRERVSDYQPEGVVVGAAIHSVRAVGSLDAEVVAEWASSTSRPLHFHLSEQTAENDEALANTEMSPTALLSKAGALAPTSTAIHATHVTKADIAMLAETGTSVCLCPTTERELADGIGPALELREAGIPICVGSDANVVVDLLEEARLIELHQRLRDGFRGAHSPEELLVAATERGKAALGRPQSGLIVDGDADFVTVSLDSVRTVGADDPVAALVLAATAQDVTDVVIGGRRIVRGGSHVSLGDVAAELKAAISAVLQQER